MNTFQTIRVAVRALLTNKLRSFLTVLGVIIGVAAVVAMVAVGEGAKARVNSAFASLGSDLLIVLPGSNSAGGMRGGFGSMPTLTWDDLTAIQTQAPAVQYASAVLRTGGQVVGDGQNWATTIFGTSPDYFALRDWPAAQGTLFSDQDVESGTKVAVLGQTVADQLFGTGADPVGQTVRIRNIPFVVIGVLAAKGQSGVGQDYDDSVYLPQTTFATKIQGGLEKYIAGSLMISADSSEDTTKAMTQVEALLRDRHHLRDGDDDDFQIRNLAEMASAMSAGAQTMSLLLSSIAAVSLLVGGIGIMNIMLVSVTERTREIGLRMAIGAKPIHILAQFLVEAVTLSVLGGFIGIGLGALIAWRLAVQFGWPVSLRPDVMAVAMIFSALVGIGFGLYPARKASMLNPIEALRYE
ncbi:MAG: ABC transporter permease [Cyanobacteria bacterium REEB65]|nr:ABC transporter permease [Cyanobacteria bacterium REEB65]